MRQRFHALATIIAIGGLILSMAAPAAAVGRDDGDAPNKVPIVFDVLFLRPIGAVLAVTGVAVYGIAVLPLALTTRPLEILEPAKPLVVTPLRFTFVDPLGYHP